MIRSEMRNLEKSGANVADQVTGRAPRVPFMVKRRGRGFIVPQRFAPKRDPYNRSGRNRRGRGRMVRNASDSSNSASQSNSISNSQPLDSSFPVMASE
jgi:hypothetical protein